MLEVILIRHGKTDWNIGRRVMGRRPIPLNRLGRQEAALVSQAISGVKIDTIYTSPIRRALETARILARGRGLRLKPAPELSEIDYGLWVGRTFDEISHEKEYQTYHTTPKEARAPKGESLLEVQERGVQFVETIRKIHKQGRIIAVSHADVIKAILLHYLGTDLNQLLRLKIDHGTFSLLWFNGRHARVGAINCPPELHVLFDPSRSDQHS